MGSVELAVREVRSFKRLYAVKRLKPAFRDDESLLRMFLDEARIAGSIRHPNVVSVLDVVDSDDEGPLLVMEYIDGVTLSALIRRCLKTNRPLPLQIVVRIGAQVADGLHAAHVLRDMDGREMRVVHRDLSPQNILIGYDGVARVTDFGIAKALDVAAERTRTETGILKGKYGYLAPEVLRFKPAEPRSDLFALGVVLFEAAASRRLYRGGVGAARAILEEPPPDLGEEGEDAPDGMIELLFRLLAKEPEQRPQSAQHVAGALREMERELVAIEGAIDLSALLMELFAEEHESGRIRVRDALSRMEEAAEPKRWRIRPIAVALASLATLATAGGALLLWSSDGTGDASVASVRGDKRSSDAAEDLPAPSSMEAEMDEAEADTDDAEGSPARAPDAGIARVRGTAMSAPSGRMRRSTMRISPMTSQMTPRDPLAGFDYPDG